MINWPFSVQVKSSLLARRWTVVCHVTDTDVVTASNYLALACAFFFGLAGRGAFQSIGSTIDRFGADFNAMTFSIGIDRNEIRGEGECDCFDPAGIGALINIIERILPETDSVLIELPFKPDERMVAPGRYPSRPDGLAFRVEDNSRDRNLEVQVTFSQVVGQEIRVRIEDILSDWWCAAALGAFRDVDQSSYDSSVVPPEVVVWEDDTMSFTVEKIRASDAFVDALVGVVAWVDRNIVAVEHLDVL